MKRIVHVNREGLAMGVNPFTHGSAVYTDLMKTQALRQALDEYGFDAAFGGARRDEEKSRAKERIFSLGSTDADRVENIRRFAEVAKLMVDAGLIVISPFRAERRMARELLDAGEFIEVCVDTQLAVAEKRDAKGLYRKARRGELKNFTGIDSPYETPERAEIHIGTARLAVEAAAELIVRELAQRGFIGAVH